MVVRCALRQLRMLASPPRLCWAGVAYLPHSAHFLTLLVCFLLYFVFAQAGRVLSIATGIGTSLGKTKVGACM